jgi:hypothetical protein
MASQVLSERMEERSLIPRGKHYRLFGPPTDTAFNVRIPVTLQMGALLNLKTGPVSSR